MITVIVLSGVAAVVGAILWVWGAVVHRDGLVVTGVVILIVFLTTCFTASMCYIEATKNVKLINAEFGTSYTADEFFWTGDVITKMIEGEAVRLKVEK